MSDLAAIAGLFAGAFLSATLLPGSSEAALIALLALGTFDPGLLIAVATFGNVLGSLLNYVLGRFFAYFRDRRWFPVSEAGYARGEGRYRRFGVWSLLFAWVPVIGDPLTLIAGALRVDWRAFVVLVTLGKFARYVFIALAFLGLIGR